MDSLRWTHLEEVMEGDWSDFGSIHLLAVLLGEEEPVGEGHVKQVCLVPMESHEVQPLPVAVPAPEECPRLSLLPGLSTSLLD